MKTSVYSFSNHFEKLQGNLHKPWPEPWPEPLGSTLGLATSTSSCVFPTSGSRGLEQNSASPVRSATGGVPPGIASAGRRTPGSVLTAPGRGSGAGDSSWWHAVPAAAEAAVAPIVDILGVSQERQQQMMLAAVRQHKQRALVLPPRVPVAHPNLRDVIDFDTELLDKTDGTAVSLGHFRCAAHRLNQLTACA